MVPGGIGLDVEVFSSFFALALSFLSCSASLCSLRVSFFVFFLRGFLATLKSLHANLLDQVFRDIPLGLCL